MYFRSQKKSGSDLSLSDAIDSDGDGGLSILDVLYEEEEDLLERLALREDCARLRACLATALNDREREIIRLRYGLDEQPPLPQREVAAALGISRSYVSRLEKKALEKLRLRLEEPGD